MESTQGNFLAHLLGQITSVSHKAVRKEVGVKPIEEIMMDMKLNYRYHLIRSTENSWLRAAFDNKFQDYTMTMYLTRVDVKFFERNTRYPEGCWDF